MDFFNSILNWVVPPASFVILAFSWPTLCFINACEWLYSSFYSENMEDKVVIITGASSGIGEQIAYEYAKRRANLVLVARREQRLRVVGQNARDMGAKHVTVIAADVVKEEDCRRFVNDTINFYGRLDHLVNTASLGHTFYFEEVTDTSVFPLLLAAKAALVNFYETLRFEVKDDVGITIATHGWIGSEVTGGKFMLEEGAEMQWKEEREVNVTVGPIEDYARLIVSGACRGDAYVKYPSWYDIFLLFRVFAPNVLNWTLRFLLATHGARRTSLLGTGRPLLEYTGKPLLEMSPSPKKLLASPTHYSQLSPLQQPKWE
ncbi:11-beta-hydroxysteroid dehydrogenase B-like isoform X2 [Carya illinoinensis]|uniref:11-beta-hydroxysteroid dehydrogenase B-like isoform X2 n=1 Tax=Carya illinoinensis TaxID=32201 RepID=UPI001C728161|nr:11-beta-hydroxysteroid dehydrogenase B-like isoform X2 [Carya illinoinensis]